MGRGSCRWLTVDNRAINNSNNKKYNHKTACNLRIKDQVAPGRSQVPRVRRTTDRLLPLSPRFLPNKNDFPPDNKKIDFSLVPSSNVSSQPATSASPVDARLLRDGETALSRRFVSSCSVTGRCRRAVQRGAATRAEPGGRGPPSRGRRAG